jgi:amino acid permease
MKNEGGETELAFPRTAAEGEVFDRDD